MSVLTLDRSAVRIETDTAARAALAETFAADRMLRLPGLFAGDLLETIVRRLRRAPFEPRIARTVYPPAVDLKLKDDDLHGLLHFVLNDRTVIDFVRDVARVPDATGFVGAVYRIAPGMGHRDSWHSDLDGNRLVALTVNLSEELFEGGELEMRERHSGRRLWRIANTGPGDGLLFALGPRLLHRIRPMRGATAKTAFAGWFCRDADRKLAVTDAHQTGTSQRARS